MGYTRYKAIIHVKQGDIHELYVDNCVADSEDAAATLFVERVPAPWSFVEIQTIGTAGMSVWGWASTLSHPSREFIAFRKYS